MMRQVFYHYATATGNKKIKVEKFAKTTAYRVDMSMASWGSTVVEHSPHHTDVKGLSLVTAAGTGREAWW